jgi:short-subunit dehydrogenase
MIELANRPMAITGASSGIGAATAVACAQAGMPVVVAARRVDRLESLVARIRGAGGRAVAVACDVTNPEQCEAVVERTVREFGSIYGVFANAGYGEEVSMLEMPDDALRAMFETNFFGTMNVVRPAAARMAAAGAGHVIICSSCLALMSIPYYGAYCATKAAQHKIGRSMRMELESKGVHVSTVHPVGTRTEFFDTAATRSQGRSALTSHSSERFMQTPEFVAGRIVRCLRRPRAEVWTGFTGLGVRLGMALCAAVPGVESFVLRRMVRSRMTKANAAAGRGNGATAARTQP